MDWLFIGGNVLMIGAIITGLYFTVRYFMRWH